MKVKRLFGVILLFLNLTLSGQDLETNKILKTKRHFLTMSFGPSFASGKQSSNTIKQNADGSATMNYYESGLGKGFSASFGYAFMFTKELGFEVNATRLFGSPEETQNLFYVPKPNDSHYINQQNKVTANLWKYDFTFLARIPYKVVIPYFKGGVILSNGNKIIKEIKEKATFDNPDFVPVNAQYTVEIKSASSIGLTSAIGIEVPLSSTANFFIELNYTSLRGNIKTWEMTKANQSGQNILDDLPASSKFGNYKEEVAEQDFGNLTRKPSLSSLSIMAGIKIGIY